MYLHSYSSSSSSFTPMQISHSAGRVADLSLFPPLPPLFPPRLVKEGREVLAATPLKAPYRKLAPAAAAPPRPAAAAAAAAGLMVTTGAGGGCMLFRASAAPTAAVTVGSAAARGGAAALL
jgi:hypothetical protein